MRANPSDSAASVILISSLLFLGAQEQEDLMKPLLLALVILLPVAKVAG